MKKSKRTPMTVDDHRKLANEISRFRAALLALQCSGRYPISASHMKIITRIIRKISDLRCELDRLVVAENIDLGEETQRELIQIYYQPPTAESL